VGQGHTQLADWFSLTSAYDRRHAGARAIATRLFARADLTADDVDVAMVFDHFTMASWTICHPPVLPGYADRPPYTAVVVRLDEGVFLVSNRVHCDRSLGTHWAAATSTRYGRTMIVVVAALKGGVGKTTTSVYLAALAAASRRPVTLVDADPQASAADWVESAGDGYFGQVSLVEAPTDRLLAKTLERLGSDDVAIVDTPPGNERFLAKAVGLADVIVVPTRIGGVETTRVEAVLELVPTKKPVGLVICSARTYTRDYQDGVAAWGEADVPVWGTVPERVAIAAGPEGWLSPDGLDAYRGVWRRALRAVRES
jgi:chromosome partitioning protein